MLSSLAGRRPRLRLLAAVGGAALLLALVFRAIPPTELRDTLAEVSPLWLLPAIAAAFTFILSRAWRYSLLLGTPVRRFPTLLAVTLSAWGAGLLLPGPSADAVFVLLARTRLRTPVAVGAGAALLSRLLDVLSLVLIALITAPIAGVQLPGILLLGGPLVGAAIALGLGALFWARSRSVIALGLKRLPLPVVLRQQLYAAVEELGSGGRPLLLVASTLCARVATGFQYFALFAAVEPLSLVQVWFALSIRTLLIAVPIQGLGGLGTMQLWWTAGLALLGWRAEQALGASLAVHLLDLCVSLPLAAAGWLVLMTRRAAPAREQPRPTGVTVRAD